MFKIKGLTKINMANRVLYACTATVATPQRDLEMVDSRSKELAVKPLKPLFHITVEVIYNFRTLEPNQILLQEEFTAKIYAVISSSVKIAAFIS